MPERRCPSVTSKTKPTTMADISRSRRSVVMSAMPDCFLMIVFTDLILVLLLLIGIEIGHAAKGHLRCQVAAHVFSRVCRGTRRARTHVYVHRANLIFVVTVWSRDCRDRELVNSCGGSSVRKIVSKLQIFERLRHRLWGVEVHRAHQHRMGRVGSRVPKIGDHPDSRGRGGWIGAVGHSPGEVLQLFDCSSSFRVE